MCVVHAQKLLLYSGGSFLKIHGLIPYARKFFHDFLHSENFDTFVQL